LPTQLDKSLKEFVLNASPMIQRKIEKEEVDNPINANLATMYGLINQEKVLKVLRSYIIPML
jgi:hypothetical protein